MSLKKLVAIRASELTRKQLGELTERLGMNQSEIITLAVDRLYQIEIVQSGSREGIKDQEDEN